jgi:hypothetical protein
VPGERGTEQLADLSRASNVPESDTSNQPRAGSDRGRPVHSAHSNQMSFQHQKRLSRPNSNDAMVRSPSTQSSTEARRRASSASIQSIRSPASSPRQPSAKAIRTLGENEALAEHLEQNRHSMRDSPPSSHAADSIVQELTRTLTSDLTKLTHGRGVDLAQLQDLINARLHQHLAPLCPVSKRSASDAGLPTDHILPRTKAQRVTCSSCGKSLPRQCDLKKHLKRHSRPWGCTSDGCYKTFGSKNDWKRHENSQHYQLETWRCAAACPTSRIAQCAKLFSRREPFSAHLRREHGVVDEGRVRDECRTSRIGRNWQSGFWCGFCKRIVRLQRRGLEAWDERFNHIDNEHFKKGEAIEEWFPMDKDVPKGALRKERARERSDRAEDAGESEEETDLDPDVLDQANEPPPPPPPPPPPAMDVVEHGRSSEQKRDEAALLPRRHVEAYYNPRAKKQVLWLCVSTASQPAWGPH